MSQTLYIKNMVCERCRMAVRQELEKLGLPYASINLGEVNLATEPTEEQLGLLKGGLQRVGFELIEDKTARIISKIKTSLLDWIRNPQANRKLKLSAFLSDTLHRDYTQLSSLFSAVEGITIEHYCILQKIEWVKELLVYDELSLSEIAHQVRYSSVQHLSNQFKKITGLTPSHFKKIGAGKRVNLDQV